MSNFMIGCDPEVFVADATGVRSIIGTIGGSKDNPTPLLRLGDGFAVQEDNVAMEFNIPPSPTREAFIHNVVQARDFLNTLVNDAFGFHMVKESAIVFPDAELENPAAHVFGCDPDYNAWTGRKNPRPKGVHPNLRSCGGHVHVGVKFANKGEMYTAAQAMDVFLGIPSVLMDDGALRKSLYGKHGAFRPKPYGFEYRTLSNFWIFDEKLIGWVYDGTAKALDAMQNNKSFTTLYDQVSTCIDKNDKDLAKQLCKQLDLEVVYA